MSSGELSRGAGLGPYVEPTGAKIGPVVESIGFPVAVEPNMKIGPLINPGG